MTKVWDLQSGNLRRCPGFRGGASPQPKGIPVLQRRHQKGGVELQERRIEQTVAKVEDPGDAP
jgi:hypothetical protein